MNWAAKKDYIRKFENAPVGLLLRKTAKLDQEAAMHIHRAVADSFYLSRFFTEVQELADSLV